MNGLERTHNLLLRRWAPYTCDYTIEIYMQYYNPYICISNPDKHIQRFVIMIGLDPTIPRSPAPGKRILLVRPNDHNNHGSVESCGKNLVIPRNFTSNDYGGTQTHNLLLRRWAPYPLGQAFANRWVPFQLTSITWGIANIIILIYVSRTQINISKDLQSIPQSPALGKSW